MVDGEMKMTIEELSNAIRSGLFAERDSLKEAFNYVDEVAKASDNPIAVWTAVMVMCNTVANEMQKVEA